MRAATLLRTAIEHPEQLMQFLGYVMDANAVRTVRALGSEKLNWSDPAIACC